MEINASDSLAALYPDLAIEFNTKLNQTTPEKVKGKSNKKVWWTCSNNHDYEAPISRRSAGSGCAFCSNTKLLEGFNDLLTVNPELGSQMDVLKTGFAPTQVMGKSSKRAWWKCSEGHSWEAVIASRAKGKGCPSCAGRKILPEKSLAGLYPEIMEFFDKDKNEVDPYAISPSSKNNLWWKCNQGHTYQQAPLNKTRQKDGCPYCSGRYASAGNNLAELNPPLARLFNEQRNGYTAYEVTIGSKKPVWWKCEIGHEWEAAPSAEKSQKLSPCPECRK